MPILNKISTAVGKIFPYCFSKPEKLPNLVFNLSVSPDFTKFLIPILNELSKTVPPEELHKITILFSRLINKDLPTAEHSSRVSFYTNLLGKKCNLTDDEITRLTIAALLHDIGKINFPHELFQNTSKVLTPLQEKIIRMHPEAGVELIKQYGLDHITDISRAVKYHHEWINGSGYPEGIKGKDIPLFAMMISIVDCFDAATSKRSYQSTLPLGTARQMIWDQRRTHFEPSLVEIFDKVIEENSLA